MQENLSWEANSSLAIQEVLSILWKPVGTITAVFRLLPPLWNQTLRRPFPKLPLPFPRSSWLCSRKLWACLSQDRPSAARSMFYWNVICSLSPKTKCTTNMEGISIVSKTVQRYTSVFSTIDRWRSRCRGRFYGPSLTYIHVHVCVAKKLTNIMWRRWVDSAGSLSVFQRKVFVNIITKLRVS
jgi:hypothetical protein